MAEKYLFNQSGIVDQLYLPGKAILHFDLNGQVQRVLLWVKSYIHQGKLLEKTDSFAQKLSVGDVVYFDCHVYNKESSDNCQWYAARASKERVSEATIQPSTKILNRSGYISEVDPGKGVILFDFYDEEQRVFFLRSKFFLFGKRLTGKRSLQEFLSENDPLQFDAEMCDPSEENFNCSWFATVVWKGKKPAASSVGQGGIMGFTSVSDVGLMDEESGNSTSGSLGGGATGYPEFPTIGLPPGLLDKQGYKAFEVSSSPREGRGNVLKLFNEECGLALWMVKCNTWETVFFHRRSAMLDIISLKDFDLQESFSKGMPVEITAVPARTDFPCRWIARRVVAKC